jgi:hypothetical protein
MCGSSATRGHLTTCLWSRCCAVVLIIVELRRPARLDPYKRTNRSPSARGLLSAVGIACLAYLCLQFTGLLLHLAASAQLAPNRLHRTDVFDTIASVCSVLAWIVLLMGLWRLAVWLRAIRGIRAQRL